MTAAEDIRSLRSGELARQAGVSTDTLRHYERLGLLPKPVRTSGGYRQYPPAALDRVLLIRRALLVGFTLPELASILKTRDRGGAPCREVQAIAKAKLAQVEEQLASLGSLRDHLKHVIEHWDQRLTETRDGERAALLESLAGLPAPGLVKPFRIKPYPIKPKER
jgi:DNA-binding transcriptional MerR regulator